MKSFSLRLPDDVAEYLEQCAADSRMSVNKTMEAILRAGRDNGWTEVSMVPTVRRAADDVPD